MQRRVFLAALALVIGFGVAPSSEADAADKKFKLLFVTQSKGFTHGAVKRKGGNLAPAEQVIKKLSEETGAFDVDFTQDCAKDFTKDNIAKYDVIMFYTTGKLPITDADLDYFFNEWMNTPGKGFIGTHSAADTFKNYKPYWDMIGGTFNGHPWGSGSTVTITVHEPAHPTMEPWGGEFTIKDEIYRFRNWQPTKVRVLASLNMAKTPKKEPYHVPIAWCKQYQKSKVFHMSLGHRIDMWENPKYQQSLLAGMRWIIGEESGESAPNPELSAAQDAKAKKDVAAAKK